MLINSDSLTSIATKYYDKHEEHHYRARAYYQHGIVQQLSDNLPLATLSLNEAYNSLEIKPQPRLKGLVLRALGDIYRASYLYNNSYDAYVSAVECFEELSLPYHIHYTYYNMGQAASKMQNYRLAETLYNDALSYAIETNDKNFICAILHELCEVYLNSGDDTKFREVVGMFEKYDCQVWFESHYLCMKAIAAAQYGDYDMAFDYLAKAEAHNAPDHKTIEKSQYHIYKYMGDLVRAINSLEHINEHLISATIAACSVPVLNDQIDLLSEKIDREVYEEQVKQRRKITGYIILMVVICLLLHFVITLRKRLRRDVQHYMETINELQLTRNNATPEPLATAIDKLYNDRLKVLNRLCETYYDHSDTPRQAAKVFEEVRLAIESIKSDESRITELEELVNKCRNNLMAKLREQCPKLNEREIKVALYSYAGFSSRAICIFIESNPVALSKIKYRMKTKIKESGAEDAELLSEAL